MLASLSLLLFLAALAGLSALLVQYLAVRLHLGGRKPSSGRAPGISILKPLCGVDDELEENLACFASLSYPRYEVVLGVKSTRDPAYEVARRACRKWPSRMRLLVQQGEPGFNPKVNQLITLESAALHDILVVSDSNTRVAPDYLTEVAALFEDPEIACVTHPIVGVGDRRLGSLLDNLYLSAAVGPGMVAANLVVGKDVVVGKSMALRRGDLQALGGFLGVKDHLAEDYVLGRAISEKLGKRVAVARTPVLNVSQHRSLGDFFRRQLRWFVIHRTAIQFPTYLAQAMLNPMPLALLAWLLCPSWGSAWAFAGILAAKVVLDSLSTRALRGFGPGLGAWAMVPLKDLVLFAAWTLALFQDTVSWRGNRLKVQAGSRLVAPEGQAEPASSEAKAA